MLLVSVSPSQEYFLTIQEPDQYSKLLGQELCIKNKSIYPKQQELISHTFFGNLISVAKMHLH